jgi:hypothetical protein
MATTKKRAPKRKRPSKLACKRRAKALPKKRSAPAGRALAACRRPAKRRSVRNGKYAFYVVDNVTGLVHAGNEFREDAADERKAMIDEGVPAKRVSVLAAKTVRSRFGAIKWGTGRPGVRAAEKNGKRGMRAPRWATNSHTVSCGACKRTCYSGEAFDTLADSKMPFPEWRCLDTRACEEHARRYARRP